MKDKELMSLHSNQRYVVLEMMKRGIEVELLDLDRELIKASYKNHMEYMLDRNSSVMPYSLSMILGDKFLTKQLLKQNNFSICDGEVFNPSQKQTAIIYASSLGYPITLKPVFGSHGDNVYVNIKNQSELQEILYKPNINFPFIIEQYFEGKEYRVFITKNDDYAVLHRDPAYVVGDGKNNLEELIENENRIRAERKNSLCPIVLDDIALRYLTQCNKKLDYIPKKEEKVYIRDTSNVAKGGVCVNATKIIHPSVLEICTRLLKSFGNLPYIGIDFMCNDISKPQTNDSYAIIEVNTIPGVSMHMKPGIGEMEDVPKMMVDLIFPETVEEKCKG